MLGAKSHRALPEHSPDLMLAQKYEVHDSVSLHTCRRNIILKFQNNIFFQFEYRGYLLYIIVLMHIKLLLTILDIFITVDPSNSNSEGKQKTVRVIISRKFELSG